MSHTGQSEYKAAEAGDTWDSNWNEYVNEVVKIDQSVAAKGGVLSRTGFG